MCLTDGSWFVCRCLVMFMWGNEVDYRSLGGDLLRVRASMVYMTLCINYIDYTYLYVYINMDVHTSISCLGRVPLQMTCFIYI